MNALPKTGLIAVALAAVVALSGCKPAESQSVSDTLSWVHPTTRVDGGLLMLSEIARTTVMTSTTPGGPYNVGTVEVTAPAASVQIPRPGDGIGTRCYVAFTVDTAGLTSGASAEACKTIAPPPSPPNPPTDLSAS